MKLSFLFFIWMATSAVHAAPLPKKESAPRVSFALAPYNPFVILESDGHLHGIYQEYLAELIQRAGLDPQFDPMPLTRMLHHATKGTYDFFMGVSGIPEAEGQYLEIARFHKMKVILIGMVDKIDFKGEPLVIGKAPNTYCPLFNKEQEKKIRYYEYKDTPQALKMLVAKRISAICTTRELFYFELQNSRYASLSFKEMSEFHHEFVISLFAHKRIAPEKIKSVNKAVTELEQKKFLSSLYKKYGLEETARP